MIKGIAGGIVTGICLCVQMAFGAEGKPNALTSHEVANGWLLLFDGDTLFGWAPRGSASWHVAEGVLVCPAGTGGGYLSTRTEFGDFELHVEFWVDEKANSGVFFRALKGQFWSGYESQIRNQWEGNDRAQPVDYGTGGIYNRQPARRVVSSDREWFTMTITAHGRHLATWVNGIQVADFTDPRPPSPNARQGYRAQAGVISLQGHDPTTDLSFRNLRIAELPPARP